jgi:hypothetical protein
MVWNSGHLRKDQREFSSQRKDNGDIYKLKDRGLELHVLRV